MAAEDPDVNRLVSETTDAPPNAPAPAPAPTIVPTRAPTIAPERPEESPSRPISDDGDHDRFAHYARKDDVARAYVTGEAIVALCGKKWIPTRDPQGYPVCPTCKERKAAGWKL